AVVSSQDPSVFGAPVSFTATVTADAPSSAVPAGSVQFKVDGADLGVPVTLDANGQATSGAVSSLAVGNHVVTAEFAATTEFDASTGTLVGGQDVSSVGTSTAVVSSQDPSVFGAPVSFTATVTSASPSLAIPAGVVQFKVDGADLGVPVTLDANGQATSGAVSSLAVGNHVVTAEFAATTEFDASTGTLVGGQDVSSVGTSTAVVAAPSPSVFGQDVTFTAT